MNYTALIMEIENRIFSLIGYHATDPAAKRFKAKAQKNLNLALKAVEAAYRQEDVMVSYQVRKTYERNPA